MARRGESLEMAVLGLLHESPLHGYELRKRLNLLLGWSRLLSYGSLYPALKKMLRAGWITDEVVPTAAVRRTRITYMITPSGREHFSSQMTESGPAAWEDDNFDVRFAFFSRTALDVRLRSSRAGARGCRSGSTGCAPRTAAPTGTPRSCTGTASSPSSASSRGSTG